METLKITYESVNEIIKRKKEKKIAPAIALSVELYELNKAKGISIDRTKEELNLLCKSKTLRFGRTLNDLYFYITK